jgi:hypothetical protein
MRECPWKQRASLFKTAETGEPGTSVRSLNTNVVYYIYNNIYNNGKNHAALIHAFRGLGASGACSTQRQRQWQEL